MKRPTYISHVVIATGLMPLSIVDRCGGPRSGAATQH